MTGGALHGGHGIVASSMYSGDTWTSTVVFMQCMHDMFGLLPRPSVVEKTETWCGGFPLGGKDRGVNDIVFCVHYLPPHQTSAKRRLI